jgi:hypothetical protein
VTASDSRHELDAELAAHFVTLALAGLHREYPNKISHVLDSDQDAAPPRRLTPAFFGCFDWHSAVHGHWTIVRLLRCCPASSFEAQASRALETSFTDEKIAGEIRYVRAPGRSGFQVPYGMGWLLTLAAELAEWDDPRARRWMRTLAPLESIAAERMTSWVSKLPWPVRTGEHVQSAFGLSLLLDWAARRGREATAQQVATRARELYGNDVAGPLHLEPSGYDFLSPCLAEADLMRRVLPGAAFADWLGRFLPGIPEQATAPWISPVTCPDPGDAKLAHLDGLNLSRAWMLQGIADALDPTDPRCSALLSAAAAHQLAGIAAVDGQHYEGSHWQGTFAVYLLTGRGRALDARQAER